jgi:hypothetical protein
MTPKKPVPLSKNFPVEDETLNEAGIFQIWLMEYRLVIPITDKDGVAEEPIAIEIVSDWDKAREKLFQQAKAKWKIKDRKAAEEDKRIVQLLNHMGMIWAENAEVIVAIAEWVAEQNEPLILRALRAAEQNSKEIFLNEFDQPFAAIKVREHVEIAPMTEDRFRNWIRNIIFKKEKKILSDTDIENIVSLLRSRALDEQEPKRHRLDVRVRGYNPEVEKKFFEYLGSSAPEAVLASIEQTEDFTEIYYDLTNSNWEAVRITPNNWQIVKDPPILFRRYGSEAPQIYPAPSGSYDKDILDQLVSLFNIKNPLHKFLDKVYIVSLFWPNTTPKPILLLNASQGSAKTTKCEITRDFVDPNAVLTTSLPKELFNLKQYLAHNYVSYFDNVSYVNDEQSDTLCRGVTGAGDMKRRLFYNDDDIIYRYKRIEGLNGITNAATRPDLLDRALIQDLQGIPRENRDLLKAIWRRYLKIKAQALSFCLDVIAEVLAERRKWKDKDPDYFGMQPLIKAHGGLPRMADYVLLGEQIAAVIARKEGRKYEAGEFLRAWDENLETLNVEALKASLLAEALIAFMTDRVDVKKNLDPWGGSSTQLLADLNRFIQANPDLGIDPRSRSWPKDPTACGKELATIKNNLAALTIVVESKRNKHNSFHRITKAPTPPTSPTPDPKSSSNLDRFGVGADVSGPTPSPTSKNPENEHENNLGVGGVGDVGQIATFPDVTAEAKRTISDMTILEVIRTALRDEAYGTSANKDYFLGRSFVFGLMMQPNLRINEDEAEQTLHALVDMGLVQSVGKDMFKPVGNMALEVQRRNNDSKHDG